MTLVRRQNFLLLKKERSLKDNHGTKSNGNPEIGVYKIIGVTDGEECDKYEDDGRDIYAVPENRMGKKELKRSGSQ